MRSTLATVIHGNLMLQKMYKMNDYRVFLSLNNATCKVMQEGRFSCLCAKGFEGDRCETNIDDCVGNECKNGERILVLHEMTDNFRCIVC